MEYKDGQSEEWKKAYDINKDDPYGKECFDYAERWANQMEEKISDGSELKDIAESTSHSADTNGITGFMYGMAVSILSQMWTHGEELRKWHNKEYNQPEAKGVVNPAIVVLDEGYEPEEFVEDIIDILYPEEKVKN